MDCFVGFLADCADGEVLFFSGFDALVAGSDVFEDWGDGGVVAVCAGFDEWDCQVVAEFVDVVASVYVVEGVDDEVELAEEVVAEVVLLDAAFVGSESD